jgi:hypothetical protein
MITVIRGTVEYIMEEHLTWAVSGKKNNAGIGARGLLPQSGFVQLFL